MGLRIDPLIGDAGAHQIEDVREQDHNAHEHEKNNGRMRDLVADRFHPVQECLQPCSCLVVRLTHAVRPFQGGHRPWVHS